jgi:GNAT superfamily N-acetyltransferase
MWQILPATPDDAPLILDLQMRAFAEEARLCKTSEIPPLTEDLASVERDIRSQTVLTAREGNRIIASARGILEGRVCSIQRVGVAPTHHGRGIGTALLRAIERAHPRAERFKLTTNTAVPGNVEFYQGLGYVVVEFTRLSETITLAQMSKPAGPDAMARHER